MVKEHVHGDTEVNKGLAPGHTTTVPRITAVSGPGVGRAVAMTRAMATVGRHPTNDLVVDDPRVSGVHLELRRANDRVLVRDAGSTNGTWLGANRVAEIELAAGAEILVGGTVLRVEMDDTAALAAVSAAESFGGLIGRSTAMREVFATLERVAKKPLNLLLQGEAGTGKEEMARAVAAESPRARAPFVFIDLTSFPEALVDVLLFGQERALGVDQAVGLLEAANGGTVFIDEVGVLPAPAQAKLLRMLERQELVRAGGHLAIKVDVRVLAATSRDLRREIEAGTFREDLYLRLAQVRVFVPPLRDRTEDIPILCERFLAAMADGGPLAIDGDAVRELAGHPWPGNVRELKNALERASALTQGGTIRRLDVAGEGFGFRGTREERTALDVSGTFKVSKERAVERFESAYLSALMRRCDGNLSLASREADLARHHLRDLLRKRALYGVPWDKVEE